MQKGEGGYRVPVCSYRHVGACLLVCVSWSPRRTCARGLCPPAPFAFGGASRVDCNSFGNSLSPLPRASWRVRRAPLGDARRDASRRVSRVGDVAPEVARPSSKAACGIIVTPEIADGGITVESAACFPPAFSRQPGLCLTAAPSSPLRAVVLSLHLLALGKSAVSRVGHTRPARGNLAFPEGSIVIAKRSSAIASQCELVQFYARDEADATTVARYLRISVRGAGAERGARECIPRIV